MILPALTTLAGFLAPFACFFIAHPTQSPPQSILVSIYYCKVDLQREGERRILPLASSLPK